MLRALILAVVLAGCVPAASPSPRGEVGTIVVTVVAGPICPVEREPPDPACEPRPVAGAPIFVQPGDGRDILVGQGATDAAGIARIEVPAGDYIVLAGDVEGLMGRPEPAPVSVVPGTDAEVTLVYDTGIR